MTEVEFSQLIVSKKKEIQHLMQRVLPIKVGQRAKSMLQQNFRDGGFFGEKWKQTRRQRMGGSSASSSYGPLLSGRNHLMASIQYTPENAEVKIFTDVEYADIHNNGGTTHPTVTTKMRRYAWARFYEANGGKKSSEVANEYARMWKSIALTKKDKLTVRIDKRQFLADHPKLQEAVMEIVDKELTKVLKM